MLSDPSLRFYAFRTLLLSSIISIPLISLSISTTRDILQLFLSCIICTHHVLSVTGVKYLLSLFDLVIVGFEASGIPRTWVVLARNSSMLSIDRWTTQKDIILAGSLYVQVTALFILLGFRAATLGISRGKDMLVPFEFQSRSLQSKRVNSWWILLFGRVIWRSRFSNEPLLLMTIRVLCAFSFVSMLAVFAIFSMVIEPVRETGMTPAKSFHTTDLIYDFNMAIPVWSIVAFLDMNLPVANYVDQFKAAVSVTPLWDDNGPRPRCVHLPGNRTFGGYVEGVQSDPYIQTITIFCPSRLDYTPTAQEAMSERSSNVSPDLIVTVNFTVLGISWDSLVDARRRTVSILVGLTNDTGDVVANTFPTPLFPDSHLSGSVAREFRQRFVKPPLASLGVFSSSRTFLVADLYALVNNPSPLIPRLQNTATLHIFGQNDFSEWTINQDYREKSVWGGLAAVGGFWTSINGVFAVMFGSSLLLILFGVKPLSIIGILDGLRRERIQDVFREEYPFLDKEAKSDQRGLLALLREHVVDLDSISGKASDKADIHLMPLQQGS